MRFSQGCRPIYCPTAYRYRDVMVLTEVSPRLVHRVTTASGVITSVNSSGTLIVTRFLRREPDAGLLTFPQNRRPIQCCNLPSTKHRTAAGISTTFVMTWLGRSITISALGRFGDSTAAGNGECRFTQSFYLEEKEET